jgi:uroporphyrinogen III methyltransferase/synthase
MAQQTQSCVYLIGAGPGDPGLITVKGLNILQRADVILYDNLVANQLLSHSRPDAQRIYVGKKAGRHLFSQEQINQLILDHAQKHNCIVRLKGGDPLVFGRGGEEALALKKAGIAFEIIPGITAGIAGPAYAGIPITHRELAGDVAFITGHEAADRVNDSQIDWEALARWRGTIIFYMGITKLDSICDQLIQHGMTADTPAAIVRWATTSKQETITDRLDQLAQRVAQQKIRPPAIIIIGKVVNLRKKLGWFEDRPLFGQQIMVTRSQSQASKLTQALSNLGATVIECPVIQSAPPVDAKPLQHAIGHLADFDWILFASVNAVDAFFLQLHAMKLDSRALSPVKIAAVGTATAQRLDHFGLIPDHIPETFTAIATAESLAKKENLTSKNILLPRSQLAPPELLDVLKKYNANVTEVIAYQTLSHPFANETILQGLKQNDIDWITFTSSSTVTHFLAQIDLNILHASKTKIASIGPTTSQTLRASGLHPSVEANPHTIAGLIEAMNTSKERL